MYKLIILSLLALLTIILIGCGLACSTPNPPCNSSMENFILNKTDFQGWDYKNSTWYSEASFGAIDSCEALFHIISGGNIIQDVYKYNNEGAAISAFSSLLDAYAFKKVDPIPPPDSKLKADNFYFACSIRQDQQSCEVLMRYGSYVVLFNSYIDPVYMTYPNFEAVIREIDKKMTMAVK
jgi:hypothetical protein